MSDKFATMGRLIMALGAAMLLMGCGGMETDPPASGSNGEDDEATKSQDEEDRQEEVQHPFTADSDTANSDTANSDTEDDGFDEQSDDVIDDDYEDESCASVCFKTLWCQEDGSDLESCIKSCESSRYNGILSGGVYDCLNEAEGCVEVARCEDQIEACTEICGVYNQCGHFSDGIGCHQWCAGQVWSDRLDWDVQGCITAAGRADACGDLAACGLEAPED